MNLNLGYVQTQYFNECSLICTSSRKSKLDKSLLHGSTIIILHFETVILKSLRNLQSAVK